MDLKFEPSILNKDPKTKRRFKVAFYECIKTKNIFLIAVFLLFKNNLYSQVSSTIDKVNLFYNGAVIERTGKLNLQAGKNEIIFNHLPYGLDPSTIQVQIIGNGEVNSIRHILNNQTEKQIADEIAKLETKYRNIIDKMELDNQSLNMLKKEEELLSKNQVIGGTYAGMKPADLKELLEYQKARFTEIFSKKFDITKRNEQNLHEIKSINTKLTSLRTYSNKTFSSVEALIQADKPLHSVDFKISYAIKNASWSPNYNFKVNTLNDPLEILCKGKVYQYTGEDWKNVKLELTNANMKKSGKAPEIKQWIWGIKNDYSAHFKDAPESNSDETQVYGQIKDKNQKPLQGVSIQMIGTQLSTFSDTNGNYRLNIPPNLRTNSNAFVYSLIGFKSQQISNKFGEVNITLEEDLTNLEELVVIGYGTQYKRDVTGSVSVIRAESSYKEKKYIEMKKLVMEEESPVAQSFELKERINLASDGKEVDLDLKEIQVPVTFEYLTVPKIDPEAFLMTYVPDWTKLNLLEGEASLFVEGIYQGKTILKHNEQDTLALSLGRDKSILIKREKVKEYTKKQWIGAKRSDDFAYKISVKNLKKNAITVVVKDQFPVTINKEVEISDMKALGAEINPDSGIITWRITLQPGEDKIVSFGYNVKYPKNGMVISE
ncbi:MAG: DUF4139 domain-containing protein [Leadbetterella sp.]